MFRLRALTLGALAFGAAACSDSPTGPSSDPAVTLDQDIADLAADGAAEDVGIMSTIDGYVPPFVGGASLRDNTPPRLTGCTFALGSFSCPRVRQNGLDVDRLVSFKDVNGASQPAYDAQTTASIRVVVAVTGDITRGPWSATISRSRDLVISGLLGTETTRTVDGTGAEQVTRSGHSRNGVARGHAISASTTVTAVVFPVHNGESDPWPLSGTMTRTFTATPLTGDPVTRTVVIDFDGTATPSGTLNGEPWTFDLTRRRASRGQ